MTHCMLRVQIWGGKGLEEIVGKIEEERIDSTFSKLSESSASPRSMPMSNPKNMYMRSGKFSSRSARGKR